MKTLCLLRHAQALPSASSGDWERPLSPAGQREAAEVGRFMSGAGLRPDQLIASAARRTRETAQAVCAVFPGLAGTYEDGLYGAAAEDWLARLACASAAVSRVLLVGHNPAVCDLALRLSDMPEDDRLLRYAPATLAVFVADAPDWGMFAAASPRRVALFAP